MALNRSARESSATGKILAGVIAVGLLALAALYGIPFLSSPSAKQLAEQALEAASAEEQISAAHALVGLGEDARTQIREVAYQSKTKSVVSICLLALSRMMDHESMDLFFEKIKDDSEAVRSAAAKSLKAILGRNYRFPVSGRIDKRNKVIAQMKKDWESYNGSELFIYNQNRPEPQTTR